MFQKILLCIKELYIYKIQNQPSYNVQLHVSDNPSFDYRTAHLENI